MQKTRRMDRSKGPWATRVLAVVLVANWVGKGSKSKFKLTLSQTQSSPAERHFSAGGCDQRVEKALILQEWV